eukprot:40180-Amphidinium_carterae.1
MYIPHGRQEVAHELCGAYASGSNKLLKSRCRTGGPLHPVVLHSQLSRIQKGQYGHGFLPAFPCVDVSSQRLSLAHTT